MLGWFIHIINTTKTAKSLQYDELSFIGFNEYCINVFQNFSFNKFKSHIISTDEDPGLYGSKTLQ
jgi:hypothetical protein